jgi:hypothetical protein
MDGFHVSLIRLREKDRGEKLSGNKREIKHCTIETHTASRLVKYRPKKK